jgi:hypothetical protein
LATSGTVGSTTIDITSTIEHACRRTGKLPASLTSEQLLSARENLYFILSDLMNRGINLWSISKQVINIVPGVATIPLGVGVVDILKALWRTSTPLSGSVISGATYQGLDLGSGNTSNPCMVQVTFNGSGTSNLVVETSPDGVTWTTVQTLPATAVSSGFVQWYDLTNFSFARAFRVRETVLGADLVGATVWNFNPSDIMMAKLNRDQFYLLPNKSFQSTRSLQYWYDKQTTPQIWLWPAPSDATATVVLWYTQHLQDPGAYTNTLQLPIRWQNGVVWLLSSYMANELPDVAPEKLAFCMQMAEKALSAAEDGESDGSPIQFDPGIAAYTK